MALGQLADAIVVVVVLVDVVVVVVEVVVEVVVVDVVEVVVVVGTVVVVVVDDVVVVVLEVVVVAGGGGAVVTVGGGGGTAVVVVAGLGAVVVVRGTVVVLATGAVTVRVFEAVVAAYLPHLAILTVSLHVPAFVVVVTVDPFTEHCCEALHVWVPFELDENNAEVAYFVSALRLESFQVALAAGAASEREGSTRDAIAAQSPARESRRRRAQLARGRRPPVICPQ